MKLIAKTIKGREFMHSRTDAAFAPDRSANIICKAMNEAKFRLKHENEVWHVYDYDCGMKYYVCYKLYIHEGTLKMKII